MKAKVGECILLRLYHKLGGLHHKNVLTHSSRTYKAESKVAFPEGREGGSVYISLSAFGSSLASPQSLPLPPHSVLLLCLYLNFSFS